MIDEWRGVVGTSDDCANNIDDNDGLGSDFGGANTERHDHSGVDLQANLGDNVFPYMDGVVDAVGWSGASGYRVLVRNQDGNYAAYCHMVDGSSPLRVGDPVFAGFTRLGDVDSTGTNSTGHHLHITVRDANGNVNDSFYDYTDTQPTSVVPRSQGGC